MDSDDGSKKEEDEHDETTIDTASEKTEKANPIKGSHDELSAGEGDEEPHVATWKPENLKSPPWILIMNEIPGDALL